jgi:hypothetical protein
MYFKTAARFVFFGTGAGSSSSSSSIWTSSSSSSSSLTYNIHFQDTLFKKCCRRKLTRLFFFPLPTPFLGAAVVFAPPLPLPLPVVAPPLFFGGSGSSSSTLKSSSSRSIIIESTDSASEPPATPPFFLDLLPALELEPLFSCWRSLYSSSWRLRASWTCEGGID